MIWGADSLAIVELVLAFEEQFEIDIPDEDTEKIRTVGDAISQESRNTRGKRPLRAPGLALRAECLLRLRARCCFVELGASPWSGNHRDCSASA